MTYSREGSTFVRHVPCNACGSRDNAGLFTDGHTYCFGCGAHENAEGQTITAGSRRGGKIADMIQGEVQGLRARKITDATCQHFNYQTGTYKNEPVQIANYYNADGQIVAQKIRKKDKSFAWLGSPNEALPFGAQAFPKNGKTVVVTEGEIDAMSFSQVQQNKWPVVSIASGAGPQVKSYIAKHRDYFNGFDRVILMFDMDAPGREAARAAAEIIGSKAAIASLPLKDANDMLVAGRTEEMVNAMWRAEPYRPEGIVDMATLKERVREQPKMGLSWPFERLTRLTYGIRLGEMYAFGAGTGIGKTDLFTQTMAHMVNVHHEKIGIFSLEQKVTDTSLRLVGKFAQRPLHIPDYWDEKIFDESWDTLIKERSVFLYDSFGRNDWESVKSKIEYLVHTEGVRYFFLDHLTAFCAGAEDERELLDGIMEEMSSLITRLNITLFFISHLATPEGKPHEEGGRVMIRHFRGSRSIGFWSHFMFGMERNQQADDPQERTITTFRVLKDRYTGRATGETLLLGYDRDKGMLIERDLAAESFITNTSSGAKTSDF
jgi:twinkle protein